MAASFQQAPLAVEKAAEFEQLQMAIARAVEPGNAEKFLKGLKSAGLRVRDWDGLIAKGVFERTKVEKAARAAYEALPVSDRAQIREFYLSRIEEVDPALRLSFKELYQYY